MTPNYKLERRTTQQKIVSAQLALPETMRYTEGTEAKNWRRNMTTSQLITARTNELARTIGIEDQLEGMSTAQKLADMAIRFSRLRSKAARAAAVQCLEMKRMAERMA